MTNERTRERRVDERHRVFGGNASIERVHGRGRIPAERARIMDWSKGGLLIKVRSPRRRLLFQQLDPVLFPADRLTCTLRLPPLYADMRVRAEVVHTERDASDRDTLCVGLRFDLEGTPDAQLEALSRILEPKARTVSGRQRRASSRRQRAS